MVEFYYWREGSGGKSRLETVALFLPDVWSAQASRVDWTTVQEQYKAACEAALKKRDAATSAPLSGEPKQPADASEETAAAASTPAPAADKSLIVCSQFCLVMFPTTCASKLANIPYPAMSTSCNSGRVDMSRTIQITPSLVLLISHPFNSYRYNVKKKHFHDMPQIV